MVPTSAGKCSFGRCSNVTLVTLMFAQSHCNIQCSPVGQVCLPSSGCSICSQSQLQQIFQRKCFPVSQLCPEPISNEASSFFALCQGGILPAEENTSNTPENVILQ